MRSTTTAITLSVALSLLAVGCCFGRARPIRSDDRPAGETTHQAPSRGELEAAGDPEQRRALALVEQVTGLRFKYDFPVYTFSEEDLRAEMEEWAAAGDGRAPENIMGFYRPSTRSMYLVPEKAGNRRAFGLRIHEATHALQDQHFGLARLHGRTTSEDEQLALTALIEGHAVQVMIDALIDTNPHVAMIAQVPEPEDPRAPGASTKFAYAAGTRFVQWLKEHGLGDAKGYAAVHKAFDHPPLSPEEIRDPESYAARVTGATR